MSNQDYNYIEKYGDITYQIVDPNNKKQLGTSFLISDKYLLTAAHVVKNDRTNLNLRSVFVKHLKFGKNEFIVAKVKKIDTSKDLCLLEINDPTKLIESNFYPKIIKDIPKIGHEVWWIGYPILPGEKSIEHYRLGKGIVCSPEYTRDGNSYYEINGEMNSGHSGGPIFDISNGNLLGMVQASVGSMNELDKYIIEIKELLSSVVEPLILDIKTLERGAKLGNVPFGWLQLTTKNHDARERVSHYEKLLNNLGFNIDLQHMIFSSNSYGFSPSISQLITMGTLFSGFINLIKAIQRSYQMGIGVTISPLEIKNFNSIA